MMVARFWRLFCLLACLACLTGLSGLAQAAEPIRIAVLAFRPKPQALTQWQPLAAALKAAIPERDFVVQAYTLTELDAVVAARQVDFVLTNPGHYVLLTRRSGLQAPLATLLMDEGGQETSAFGGVMLTRSDHPPIASLADFKGLTLATVGQDSLGGYQMQAYELLQAGVNLTQDTKLLVTGMPQDKVVSAVLEGQADVGFVRSGLLEAMAREGKLDPSRVTVINAQKLSAFPVKSSTALYPEWPFSYLVHVDERLARQVTAALFLIGSDSPAARAMGIRGFSVPADYTPVADVLRALRMPPFDVAPAFTWRDVAMRYRLPLVIAGVALTLILLLSGRLWLTGHRLRAEKQRVVQQQQALIESEFRWKFSVGAAGGGLWDWDVAAGTLFLSDTWKAMLGYAPNALSQSTDEWESRVHPDDHDAALEALNLCLSSQTEFYVSENRVRCEDGSYKWLLERGQVVSRDAAGAPLRMIGIDTDITERKLSEEKIQLAASVFSSAREGIFITNANGIIIDINRAFSLITGYSREEAIGQSPRILKSGVQSEAFYAAMFADLKAKDHWYGEVWNRRKDGALYAEMLTISEVRDARGQVTHYVAIFVDITALKEHQKQLEHIAHFDALTNLPNRVLLADRMHQAMVHAQRRGQTLAVAYLDLDGFKLINDTYGHGAGDQLLVAVSQAVKLAMREGDTLARIGGDEFVAVLADLTDATDCQNTLNRLLTAAAQPMPFGDFQLQVSASLGVTFFPQADPVDADQLMRQADQAMYQAKLSGKNRYHVFDAVLDRSVRGLHERIDEIARALSSQEFVLYYQPKVNLRTGQVVGAEALIRWQHPSKGLLSPALFLPVIEDHLLSVALGDWVIDAALKQLGQWQALGLTLPVSVNVSARQLQGDDFVKKLCDALAQHPAVSPALLSIEVLETSVLEDLGHVADIISACARLGVTCALDDFGTGYSSLTYLKHLPVTLIKIDQSFVRDMLADADDLSILQGVISLARAFQRDVIAEGMETREHGTRLLQLGCELAQGYGIARPMPAADVPHWLATWQPDPAWQLLVDAPPALEPT
ncbi:MAG: EAL domain-containing protein [Rhodoferax sp.]|uniref:EAL domain-containing protein n=1 Tax=Rhodoferax sp. TaxID=50421 RepID=UPI002619D33E|nr:EAL domain-containing protein [Rhodoferax sp.]MDD2879074.1 EAL domain-containing protein [Rhodoferax sp.]